MNVEEVERFLGEQFPQSRAFGARLLEVGEGWARVRLEAGEPELRPGGTVSGPALFTLADHAMYCLLLSAIGPVALAVTTSASIDFLRRPAPGEVIAEAEMLKQGRRLVVGRVTMRGHDGQIVAHATLTYSLPRGDGTSGSNFRRG